MHAQFYVDVNLFICYSDNQEKLNLFFDNVHLLGSNLLILKKFVFPVFTFFFYQTNIEFPAGYFACVDLKYIHKQNKKLDCGLVKGYRLTFKSIHPSNDKQNVSVAMTTFCESTVAAKSYNAEAQNDCQ